MSCTQGKLLCQQHDESFKHNVNVSCLLWNQNTKYKIQFE